MTTLTNLFRTHGRGRYYTDKGDGHTYLPTYDELLLPYKDKKINLLEIGHSAGGALRLFDDYFTHQETRIIGVDLSHDDANRIYGGAPYHTKRVETYIKSVFDIDEDWFKEIGFRPDIVIEDSDHVLLTQIWIVGNILPLVNEGGILVIEDVAYPQERVVHFDKLNIPFECIDLNWQKYTADNALIIYRK